MVQFWLDNITFLLSPDNFKFDGVPPLQAYIQKLNIIALVALIIGLIFAFRKKNVIYFGGAIIVMSLTILIKSNMSSSFTNVSELDSAFDTGAFLTRNVSKNDPSGLNNALYVNEAMNFNKGDIIALSNNNSILETNIVSDIKYTTDKGEPVLILLNSLKGNYSKYTTKILKVSDAAPEIISPPDGNISIQGANNKGMSDPTQISLQNYPKFNLPNQNRFDWNLDQSTMIPGTNPTYVYQGQPYGDLKCRSSTVNNPMGTINVTEYDQPPTMYGTCNVAEMTDGVLNDTLMTTNQEATVSQSVNDLLFHRGNSQMVFNPMPVDTLPDNQESFANWVYNTPTNGVNPKYASIFVNDPEKYKMVARLAKAQGNEGGSGNR
jgi:hypothetical protein